MPPIELQIELSGMKEKKGAEKQKERPPNLIEASGERDP